nr:MAG TPA: hypothetical protein [Caudoviricetes sp.]
MTGICGGISSFALLQGVRDTTFRAIIPLPSLLNFAPELSDELTPIC